MNQFEVAQGFIEQCQAGAPVDALAHAFQRGTEALGFEHFACCSHVDPLQPPRRAVMLHTYPKEWSRLFTQACRDELTPSQQEIFHEARRYGLARGYTVPIHSINGLDGFRASCSVVPDSDRLPSAAYLAVQLMAFHMYDAATSDAAMCALAGQQITFGDVMRCDSQPAGGPTVGLEQSRSNARRRSETAN